MLMNLPLNIDFQQVFLHLLNFFILTLGLYILLYKPIVKFLKEREAKYQAMDQEAKSKLAEADHLLKERQEQIANLTGELTDLKNKTLHEAQVEANYYIESAEAESKKIKERAYQAAKADQKRILENANHEVKNIVSQAVERASLADESAVYEEFFRSAEPGEDKVNG